VFACCCFMQMCRIADRWQAPVVVRVCFSGLAKLRGQLRTAEEWTAVELALPVSVQSLAGYEAWRDAQTSTMARHFNDVHAMLTDGPLLRKFLNLPFPLVSAWASSGDLVVDSENSVAVALTVWAEGPQGKESSDAQLKQLSGLLRVKHLSASKRSIQVRCLLNAQTLLRILAGFRSRLQMACLLFLFPMLSQCIPNACSLPGGSASQVEMVQARPG
jgi:hypothetical protein